MKEKKLLCSLIPALINRFTLVRLAVELEWIRRLSWEHWVRDGNKAKIRLQSIRKKNADTYTNTQI